MGSRGLGVISGSKVFRTIAQKNMAHEKVALQLKEAILGKYFSPGQRIPSERELAEVFRTSRVTIRSAILSLRNVGLLKTRKGMGGGTFVAEDLSGDSVSELLKDFIQWKDVTIRDVIEAREIIEPSLAYLAAKNATSEDIKRIQDTIVDLENQFKVKKKFKAKDENFHKALAIAARNPILALFQSALINILFRCVYEVVWKEEHKQRILHYHNVIAEKVGKGDPKGARNAMVDHLSDMRSILEEYHDINSISWLSAKRQSGEARR